MMDTMLPCDQVMDRLWDYLDGELDAETAERIRDHLDVCSHCFPQYDFRRAFKELIQRSGEGPVPPGLRRQIFEALLQEDAREGGAGSAPNWWIRLRRRFLPGGA